jgi:hypothetical protein
MGSEVGRLVAKVQVSEVGRSSSVLKFCSILAPPAGFEPAHTAPECIALHAFYLRKRDFWNLLGRVWGAGIRQYLNAVSSGQGDGHDVEAGDALEVADVGGSDAPSGGDGGGGDEPVVGSDVEPGCC